MYKVTWINNGQTVVSAVDVRDFSKFQAENVVILVESFK
jgi:hypothetical protein